MPICTTFYNMRKDCVYSLSPESLRTMVLMRKDVLYECVKRYVKKRKEDPYLFFTPSLRTRKFNFSCCEGNQGTTRGKKKSFDLGGNRPTWVRTQVGSIVQLFPDSLY